eukprot:1196123-Prorocentrum_minimum.AAC.8
MQTFEPARRLATPAKSGSLNVRNAPCVQRERGWRPTCARRRRTRCVSTWQPRTRRRTATSLHPSPAGRSSLRPAGAHRLSARQRIPRSRTPYRLRPSRRPAKSTKRVPASFTNQVRREGIFSGWGTNQVRQESIFSGWVPAWRFVDQRIQESTGDPRKMGTSWRTAYRTRLLATSLT